MGQPVAVVVKPSSTPGVLRFEANRNLTGMGHEEFASAADAIGPRPAASLARQLLATGHVDKVHIFGNIVTVELARGFTGDDLPDVVRDMYQYWKPGMEPSYEEPTAEPAAGSSGGAAPAGAGADGGAGVSAYEQMIPVHLRERSAAALAKWRANH
ncbi:MAG: hypothetical protein QM733_10345 [Ilumatobacteraceae bacterium]